MYLNIFETSFIQIGNMRIKGDGGMCKKRRSMNFRKERVGDGKIKKWVEKIMGLASFHVPRYACLVLNFPPPLSWGLC